MDVFPIRNDEDHAAALAVTEGLWGAAPGTEPHDRLDVLAMQVEAYEAQRWPIAPPDPTNALRAAMGGATQTVPGSAALFLDPAEMGASPRTERHRERFKLDAERVVGARVAKMALRPRRFGLHWSMSSGSTRMARASPGQTDARASWWHRCAKTGPAWTGMAATIPG
ncbi:helix-turn-helix domain-containing protein [Novosphingobium decolorationis]|uniref:Transcriptional regulator n=1 Tax=Novosphingobium decolorationis TaxID=2698673 RepID=A0ABX8EAJ6_9SPHN|nr:hypothetical protein [Novosphingobium decolorationis]QVM85181.1 hypothetical protein HT578_17090 [Novosphingobium decolorationis]